MTHTALDCLYEAIGKSRDAIPADNLFRTIGFDGPHNRLGWVVPPPSSILERALDVFLTRTSDSREFVFTGMGGSINGVCAFFELEKDPRFHTINSIDPRALEALRGALSYVDRLKVLPISKSGTTSETQLVSSALKELFGAQWQKHFLWLCDPAAREKLDALGWKGVAMHALQANNLTDVGGRFSCPHTFVFLSALSLAYGREKTLRTWEQYAPRHHALLEEALRAALRFSEKPNAYFLLKVKPPLDTILRTWLIQLFQESLGSKKEGFAVKTELYQERGSCGEGFDVIEYMPQEKDPLMLFLSTIYFFEAFIAFFSFLKGIVFVTQEYVERYKQKEKELLRSKPSVPDAKSLANIIHAASAQAHAKRFIEVVLFFYPESQEQAYITRKFQEHFPNKKIFCFEGSDWNHHSYQASFLAEDTQYVFLVRNEYRSKVHGIAEETIAHAVVHLRAIAEATYQTLRDKSLYCALSS